MMPAFISKQELVNYYTYDGLKQSRIVGLTQVNDIVYFRLENGDYVKDTKLGFVKSFGHDELLKIFNRYYGGKTAR